MMKHNLADKFFIVLYFYKSILVSLLAIIAKSYCFNYKNIKRKIFLYVDIKRFILSFF